MLFKLYKAGTILLLILLVAVSGCVCCMGLDSPFSKYKKPVADLEFPDNATIGESSYRLVYSNVYPTENDAKAGIYAFAEKLGYSPSRYGGQVDVFWGMTGVKEYRSFKYAGSGASQVFGGLVAVTPAPSSAVSGYTNIKQTSFASMPLMNDEHFNIGTVKGIVYDGTVDTGDGGDAGHAVIDGQTVYLLSCRYSNTYVLAYSFESADRVKQVAQFAIGQIDSAA